MLIVGSGGAALSAALRTAAAGLSVQIVEKSSKLGGTTAMSGAGIWIPANHLMRAAGVEERLSQGVGQVPSTRRRRRGAHDANVVGVGLDERASRAAD